MNLKAPCPHDLYDQHQWDDWGESAVTLCPGGSLLPPDSLVIVKNENGTWPWWAVSTINLVNEDDESSDESSDTLDALAAAQPGRET